MLHPRAVDPPRLSQVDKDEVVVGAAGHDHVTQLLHLVAERLAVAQHLQRGKDWQAAMDGWIDKMTNLKLVLLELGRLRLLEGNSHSGDGVVVGAALERGEDGAVNPLGEVMRDNNFVTRDFKIIIEAMTLQE